MGGSDSYIILSDCDLESSVQTCVSSRLINAGQTCISAKRFIIEESMYDKFEEMFVDIMRQKKTGDPMSSSTSLAPLARYDLRDNLHRQVQESITKGAKLLLGGEIPKDRGIFYPASVLYTSLQDMPACNEELFGPVAVLIKVKDEKEAIHIANSTSYGLAAAVFTGDPERGKRIAEKELEAGSCFVNSLVKSDPRLPFGGIKSSGYGRELSHFGILEFVNIKTIFFRKSVILWKKPILRNYLNFTSPIVRGPVEKRCSNIGNILDHFSVLAHRL